MTTASYNLLDEPWISCTTLAGNTEMVSIRDVFTRGHDLAEVRGDSPTQDYAVLRVLLAIFWCAHRKALGLRAADDFDAEEWFEDAWEALDDKAPDTICLDYLEQYRDRFDLLHPTTPFMQVADLHTSKNETKDVSRLVPETESAYFTMRAGKALDTLSFAEATRWLIHCQAYDYSGIKSGAVGDPRVKGGRGYPIGTGWSGMTGGTAVLGQSLAHTLLLNTTGSELVPPEEDQPVWERDPDTAAERSNPVPHGAADLATWQSRRIRLHHDGSLVTAVLVSNGDQIPNAGANVFADPMTPMRFSKNKSTKTTDVYYPRSYDSNRTMWRSLEPLIALEGDIPLARGEKASKRPRTLDFLSQLGVLQRETVGLRLTSMEYGPQAAVVSDVIDARLALPLALLDPAQRAARRRVLQAASHTLNAAVALGQFAGSLLQAAGGDYAFQAKATDDLLHTLEPEFRTWIGNFASADSLDAHAESWDTFVRAKVLSAAAQLLAGCGPKAMVGRVVTVGDREQTVSASTSLTRLKRSLREALPLAARHVEHDRTASVAKEAQS